MVDHMKITQAKLIEKAGHIPATLIRATIRQAGGWQSFTESAADVCRGGANAGWHGFIYHAETVPFTKRNRDALLSYAGDMARDMGEKSACALIAGFNCVDLSSDEVAEAIYNPKSENATEVYNALAWFALEEVVRAYCDLTE